MRISPLPFSLSFYLSLYIIKRKKVTRQVEKNTDGYRKTEGPRKRRNEVCHRRADIIEDPLIDQLVRRFPPSSSESWCWGSIGGCIWISLRHHLRLFLFIAPRQEGVCRSCKQMERAAAPFISIMLSVPRCILPTNTTHLYTCILQFPLFAAYFCSLSFSPLSLSL